MTRAFCASSVTGSSETLEGAEDDNRSGDIDDEGRGLSEADLEA